jgi:hypothetical protein
MFRIRGKDKKENFKILKQKIDDWDNAGAWVFINVAKKDNEDRNQFYEIIDYLQKNAVLASFS